MRDRLAEAGAQQEQRDDDAALHGPERIGMKVLPREPEVREVEAEVENRHPDDRRAAQRVEPVETQRPQQRVGGGRHHGAHDSAGEPVA